MAHPSTVKKQVRERDNQRCCECGMTAEEHKQRFGRRQDIHRTEYIGHVSLGPYEVGKCQTLCTLCHQAKHNLRLGTHDSIRKRDGWACTECGIYEEEHRKLHRCPLHVHCKVEGRCDKWGFRGQEAKAEECCTLCRFCHLGKHSIHAVVLKRDQFKCVDCGKQPEDQRRWPGIMTVHRMSGKCDEESGPDADPAGFVTLCWDCHEKRHPERFDEYIQFGGAVWLDESLASELEIALPITSKDQAAPYKEYLLLVNQFIEHFRKNGLPANDYRLGKFARDFPDQRLSLWLRRKAAYDAQEALTTARAMTSAPIPSPHSKGKEGHKENERGGKKGIPSEARREASSAGREAPGGDHKEKRRAQNMDCHEERASLPREHLTSC